MIDCGQCEIQAPPEILMKIIKAQTKIVKIGHELSCVMNEVVKNAMELTGSCGAAIELAEEGEMVYRSVAGSLEPFLGFRLSMESSLSGRCIVTGDILYAADTEIDRRVDRNAARIVGAQSMIVVPLKYGDQNVGVLKVISSKKKLLR